MANKKSIIELNYLGVDYTFLLTYKKIRSVIFRAVPGEKTKYKVSLPLRYPTAEVLNFFKKNHPQIVGLSKKATLPEFNEETYFFGVLLPVSEVSSLLKVKKELTTLEDFYQKSRKVLLSFLTIEVNNYRRVMNIKEVYTIRLRNMTTRWATNNVKKHILTFNTKLIHYDHEIIKALIVHELVHHYVRGHQRDFYLMCEKYYPGYRAMDKKLKEHNYENNN